MPGAIHRIIDIINQPGRQRRHRRFDRKSRPIQPPERIRQGGLLHIDRQPGLGREGEHGRGFLLVGGRGPVAGEDDVAGDRGGGDVFFRPERAAVVEGEEVVEGGLGVGEFDRDGGGSCRVVASAQMEIRVVGGPRLGVWFFFWFF